MLTRTAVMADSTGGIDAGYALNCADACAFRQHGNHGHFLFGFQYVCHIVFFVDINVIQIYIGINNYFRITSFIL
jgi:hypothetical protein